MTRGKSLGKGKAKKRGGMDGDGGEANRGRLGESQAQTDEDNTVLVDRKVWSASRRRKRRREDNQDRTEERGVWREKPEAPREGRACTDR